MNEQREKSEPSKLENLELNRETLQDLTEKDAERARGGLIGKQTAPNSAICSNVDSYNPCC